jgi:hypothetical protein
VFASGCCICCFLSTVLCLVLRVCVWFYGSVFGTWEARNGVGQVVASGYCVCCFVYGSVFGTCEARYRCRLGTCLLAEAGSAGTVRFFSVLLCFCEMSQKDMEIKACPSTMIPEMQNPLLTCTSKVQTESRRKGAKQQTTGFPELSPAPLQEPKTPPKGKKGHILIKHSYHCTCLHSQSVITKIDLSSLFRFPNNLGG